MMGLSQEQLEALFEPMVEQLRGYGEQLGFVVMAVAEPFVMQLEDGREEQFQPFLMRTNAARVGAICGLLAKALESVAESELNPQVSHPGGIN